MIHMTLHVSYMLGLTSYTKGIGICIILLSIHVLLLTDYKQILPQLYYTSNRQDVKDILQRKYHNTIMYYNHLFWILTLSLILDIVLLS